MQTFQPLIGDSFSNLGQQSAFWAGFNGQIENANIARAAEAADKASRYNFAVSQAQREDAFRQAGLDEAAKRSSIVDLENQAANRRHAYEFGVSTDIAKRGQDINDRRYKFAQDEKTSQDKSILDTVDNTAKFLAPGVSDYGTRLDESLKAYQDAQTRMTTLASELEKDLPPGKAVYNPHVMEFIPVKSLIPATDAENKKISEANAQINDAKALYQAAATTYQTHLSAFDTLQKQALQNGLVVTKDNGKWVVRNPRPGYADRSYTPPTAVNPLAPNAGAGYVPDTTTQAPNPFTPSTNVMNPEPTLGTGTGGYQWNAPALPSVAPTKQWTRDANGKLVLVQ